MDKSEANLLDVLYCLHSGVHPKNLSEDEVETLKSNYGDDWLSELGYSEEWLANNLESV